MTSIDAGVATANWSSRVKSSEFVPAGWLFIRLVLGIEWLRGGWEKLGTPGWTAAPVGKAVGGFLNGAIAKSTQGQYPEVAHWFHDLAQDVFLPNVHLLAYLVSVGEILIGVGLIIGGLTRIAAVFGVAMNAMFLWAGTSSANPQMLLLGLAVALLGGRAGEYGLDRWLLPWLAGLVGRRVVAAVDIVIRIGSAVVAAWLAWIAVTQTIWLAAAAVAIGVYLIETRVLRPALSRGDRGAAG